MELEEGYRSIDATVHDLDEKRHAVIVDIPHEQLDAYATDFARGAFSESFRSHLPQMLYEHRPSLRLGEAVRAEVLSSSNRIVGQFDDFESNPNAARGFRDIRDGKTKGWSFHFLDGTHIPHPTVRGARRYTKAFMEEFSAVKEPAIPGTATIGIRSRPDAIGRWLPLHAELAAKLEKLHTRVTLDHFDRLSRKIHQLQLAEIRRTGKLDTTTRANCYDAWTRKEQETIRLQDELEAALDRAGRRR